MEILYLFRGLNVPPPFENGSVNAYKVRQIKPTKNLILSDYNSGNLQSPMVSLPQSPSSRITYIASDRNHQNRKEEHDFVSKEDYSILLNKIASMQEEKWAMEQKLSMLEASSSAMAEDLMKKSDIILHYCMEGGKHRSGKKNIKLTLLI